MFEPSRSTYLHKSAHNENARIQIHKVYINTIKSRKEGTIP